MTQKSTDFYGIGNELEYKTQFNRFTEREKQKKTTSKKRSGAEIFSTDGG